MTRMGLAVLLVLLTPGLVFGAFQTPPYQPVAVTAKVAPYVVEPDLSNVANRKQFGKLTKRQKELLAKQGFFVSPGAEKQFYFLYEKNDYLVLPSFVSADSALHLYHIFYDYSLRGIEGERLIPLAERLTKHMLARSVATYRGLPEGNVKSAALRNVAYFGVAARALGTKAKLPAAAREMVDKEWKTIQVHRGREKSAVFPYQFDFSQFVPRGHYTRSEKLKRYFRAMMWYGLVPFALEWPEAKQPPVIAYEQIRQSLLITRTLYDTKLGGKPAIEAWERIYEPTAFYVELADDLTPAEWRQAALQVWGHLPGPAELDDKAKLTAFHDVAMKVRQPRIATFPGKTSELERIADIPTGPQFRFMGQRTVPDSYMLQQLVWSNVGTIENQRRMPLGLDVCAALGSDRAYQLLKDMRQPEYLHYTEQMDKLRAEFAAKTDSDWRSNLYWGWLWTLRGVMAPAGEGYPSFMRTAAWLDKELFTSLASWAELRHDTILYAKQSVTAECGDGDEGKQPPVPKGYVEPVPEVYHRLLWLTRATRAGLKARELLPREMDDTFGQMEDLLAFLERISLKELANQPLKPAEYEQIRVIGAELEGLTNAINTAIGGKQGELISEADEDMAVIADVHSDLYREECLEEGVGHAYEIYVVVPIQGKLYLTRGPVFSYYEFKHPIADRLTDEAWQKLLGGKKPPKVPSWTFLSFMTDPKSKISIPKLPRTDFRTGGGGGC